MRSRSLLLGVLAVIILAVLGAFAWTWRSSLPPASPNEKPVADQKTIWHGAALAAIGNCADCHTAVGGKDYAGGRPVPTPFGTIYSSNITPDRETGIGTWSEEAFRRAMHDGVDREGRQLYPAFPYDHFTKATDADIHALYAYLMSRPAVSNNIPPNDLRFPFSFRPIVAGWKILFLNNARFQPDSGKSAEWNRGQYLVEGLGHCGACHTPRNALGAERRSSAYTGGVAEGWTAPPLNARQWTVDALTEYLATGWHKQHGAAVGPMASVAENLARASKEDVRAIATYIASLPPSAEPAAAPAVPPGGHPVKDASPETVAIFEGACAKCHNNQGNVGPSKALPLSLSTAVRQADPSNAVRVIVNGIRDYADRGGPYMPAFGDMLTDAQIAALAEYVRARFTDQPKWADVKPQISAARQKEGDAR